MYNSNCNQHDACDRGCASKCNRVGERIVVNRCGENRNRCSCANTYRPGCGCNPCANSCPRPRPCPPKPSCEDRCREQYRHCMKNCRIREECHDYDDDNGHDNCSCHKD